MHVQHDAANADVNDDQRTHISAYTATAIAANMRPMRVCRVTRASLPEQPLRFTRRWYRSPAIYSRCENAGVTIPRHTLATFGRYFAAWEGLA